MDRRFYCDRPILDEDPVLEGAEAAHLTRVLRAREGDQVVLFDGTGWEFQARVASIGRQRVRFEILAREAVDRELPFGLHAGVALPKGDRQKWLVEKAVELGVASLTPLRCGRAVVEPGDNAVDRLRRYVVEASKQSGRNRLLDVRAPSELTDFCQSSPSGSLCWFAHPGSPPLDGCELCEPRRAAEIRVAVGPEGGWTDEEVAMALAARWRIVGLGPRTLRVETALCALASVAALCHACIGRRPG